MNLFSFINQFLSLAILSLWSLLSPFLPLPATSIQYPESRIATPSATLTATPAPPTVTLNAPAVKTQVIQTTQPVPWGQTEKIGEHLYRTYVGSDPVMGTPEEILSALNNYRRNHNARELSSDPALCQLAQRRAAEQEKLGNLDTHKGLVTYMDNPKHWEELNVTAIGENASYGYILSGVHLIEWVFDSDEEHRSNQLNPNWSLACAGVSGVTVDIIFGRR